MFGIFISQPNGVRDFARSLSICLLSHHPLFLGIEVHCHVWQWCIDSENKRNMVLQEALCEGGSPHQHLGFILW